MNISECYEQFNGNYAEVISRLSKEERIVKYCRKFLDGNDCELISEALAKGNFEEAFRYVHNLKGVALNLGFTPLFTTGDTLCEYLRGNQSPDKEKTDEMLTNVKKACEKVRSALLAYFA